MSGWELTTILSGVTFFIAIEIFSIAGWVRAQRKLDKVIEVNRVLYADWQSIPVYVTDTGELQCSLRDCPTDGFFALPGRRTSMRAVVVAVSEHVRHHHPQVIELWKAAK